MANYFLDVDFCFAIPGNVCPHDRIGYIRDNSPEGDVVVIVGVVDIVNTYKTSAHFSYRWNTCY